MDDPTGPARRPRRTKTTRDEAEKTAPEWSRLFRLRNAGILLVTAVALTFVGREWLDDALTDWSSSDFVVKKLYLGLFLATLLLLLMWWYVTDHELEMLKRIGLGVLPPVQNTGPLAVGAAAIALTGLVLTANRPLFYAAILAFLKAVEVAEGGKMIRTIEQGIVDARQIRRSEVRSAQLDALHHYYVGRPTRRVGFICLGLALIALALALAADLWLDPPMARSARGVSAAVLILAVVGNELIYAAWRRKRDIELREAP